MLISAQSQRDNAVFELQQELNSQPTQSTKNPSATKSHSPNDYVNFPKSTSGLRVSPIPNYHQSFSTTNNNGQHTCIEVNDSKNVCFHF